MIAIYDKGNLLFREKVAMKNTLIRKTLLCLVGAAIFTWTLGCDLGTYGRRFEENKGKYNQRQAADSAASVNQ